MSIIHPISKDRLSIFYGEGRALLKEYIRAFMTGGSSYLGTDVEEHLGTMCNIVKNKYKGFLAGQVFEYAGFISKEGSVGDYGPEGNHIAIITYWSSFDEHERSHADEDFKSEFCKLLEFCDDVKELGYKLMWQGEQELDNLYKETVK